MLLLEHNFPTNFILRKQCIFPYPIDSAFATGPLKGLIVSESKAIASVCVMDQTPNGPKKLKRYFTRNFLELAEKILSGDGVELDSWKNAKAVGVRLSGNKVGVLCAIQSLDAVLDLVVDTLQAREVTTADIAAYSDSPDRVATLKSWGFDAKLGPPSKGKSYIEIIRETPKHLTVQAMRPPCNRTEAVYSYFVSYCRLLPAFMQTTTPYRLGDTAGRLVKLSSPIEEVIDWPLVAVTDAAPEVTPADASALLGTLTVYTAGGADEVEGFTEDSDAGMSQDGRDDVFAPQPGLATSVVAPTSGSASAPSSSPAMANPVVSVVAPTSAISGSASGPISSPTMADQIVPY